MFFCCTVYTVASVAERSIALDCKSSAFGLRRFESSPAHRIKNTPAMPGVFFILTLVEEEDSKVSAGIRRQ